MSTNDTINTSTVVSESETPIDSVTGEYMLTTYDNPYNPFTQFNLWFKHDLLLGHNSCGLLDKVACVNFIQSEKLNEKDINDAIDYICEQFPLIYKKVTKSDYEKIEN